MNARNNHRDFAHIDTLRETFSFPAGLLERDPHSSTPHLAYNVQNGVASAYENALSELLTKLEPWIQISQRREEGVSRPDREGNKGAVEEGDSGVRSGRRGGEGRRNHG